MTKHVPRGLAVHLISHPGDTGVVVAAAWNLRRPRWWAHWPFLPVPDPQYWEFRRNTAFGLEGGDPTARDVVAAARWSRAERRRR